MARDYLAVGGSGVPVESFFSTGTDVLTENRQNLSADHIKMLMLMKCWPSDPLCPELEVASRPPLQTKSPPTRATSHLSTPHRHQFKANFN
ncbi:unnamed protein product [Orchesella dallaii]|uniref:HAT C-terminal dimerisation domain-containing protein n=1 Tax=Orchesella dallaii TaxID=48710 RepID=A0ABP1RLB6_9HEXA